MALIWELDLSPGPSAAIYAGRYHSTAWNGLQAPDANYPKFMWLEGLQIGAGEGPAGEDVLKVDTSLGWTLQDNLAVFGKIGGLNSANSSGWWDASQFRFFIDTYLSTEWWDNLGYVQLIVAGILEQNGLIGLYLDYSDATHALIGLWNYIWPPPATFTEQTTYTFTRAATENKWSRFEIRGRCGTPTGANPITSVAADGYLELYWSNDGGAPVLVYSQQNIALYINNCKDRTENNTSTINDVGGVNYLRCITTGFYGFTGPITNLKVYNDSPAASGSHVEPANNACANAISISFLAYNDTKDTVAATDDGPLATAHNNIWYKYTPTSTRPIIINTSGYSTVIGVHTGSCGSLTTVTSAAANTLQFTPSIGVEYKINIGSVVAGGGDLEVEVTEALPDQVENLTVTVNNGQVPLSTITLDWDALPDEPVSYYIYESLDGGAYSHIVTVSGSVTTYDAELQNDLFDLGVALTPVYPRNLPVTHRYKVAAVTAGGAGNQSNAVQVIGGNTKLQGSAFHIDSDTQFTYYHPVSPFMFFKTFGMNLTDYESVPEDAIIQYAVWAVHDKGYAIGCGFSRWKYGAKLYGYTGLDGDFWYPAGVPGGTYGWIDRFLPEGYTAGFDSNAAGALGYPGGSCSYAWDVFFLNHKFNGDGFSRGELFEISWNVVKGWYNQFLTIDFGADPPDDSISNAPYDIDDSFIWASWAVPSVLSEGAELSYEKSHVGDFVRGNQGEYTVLVTNIGDTAYTATATVTENIPSGLTLVSMSGTGWSCVGNVCTRNDDLAAGDSYPPITVIVSVDDDAPDVVVNEIDEGATDETNILDSATIIVAKVTNSGLITQEFTINTVNLDPPSFTLKDGEEQEFSGLIPGTSYGVSEEAEEGWRVDILVSNGNPPDNIIPSSGEEITVMIVNTRSTSYSGIYFIHPNKTNDSIWTLIEG